MYEDLENMSDEQLLSAILPSCSSIHLLSEYTLPRIFTVVSEEQIAAVKGIGDVKKRTIAVIREIIRRIQKADRDSITVINGPDDTFSYFNYLTSKEQEEFWVLLLNNKNHIIGSKMISRGTISSSISSPREIFNYAVKHMAASIILAHNHPSGDAVPSKEDVKTTNQLVEASQILGIGILDHVIIGKYGNYSMRKSNSSLWDRFSFQ